MAPDAVGVMDAMASVPRCRVCGYNCEGLDRSNPCPECGTADWYSLRGVYLGIEATESLIAGIAAVVFCFIPPVGFFAGVLAIMYSQKSHPGSGIEPGVDFRRRLGRGLGIAGLLLSCVFAVVYLAM